MGSVNYGRELCGEKAGRNGWHGSVRKNVLVIDLLTDSEEQEIADTISRMLADTYPVSRFRVAAEERSAADADIVTGLAALGAPGLGISEESGGLGLGSAVEALAFREYGRFLVSPRMLGTVIAARIATAAGEVDRSAALIAGKICAGVAIARNTNEKGRIHGEVQLFDVGPDRLFALWGEHGAGLYDASVLDCCAVKGLDETLTMEVADASGIQPLLWVEASTMSVPLLGDLFAAAMMVGMTEAVRDMAVAYAKEREQFGKPIGHFQAIKHKCADMALHAEAAWCETVYAALDLDNGGDGATFHILNAKMLASRALLAAAKDNIQVHGGMGYTTEVPAHHFIKRGRILSEIGSNARQIRPRLLDLPFMS